MSQYFDQPQPGPGGPPQQPGPANRGTKPVLSKPALFSLILSFLGFCAPVGVVAIILGIVGLVTIKKSDGKLTGKPLALAGIIISLISFVTLAITLKNYEAPVQTAFEKAESSMTTANPINGNTPEAIKMAKFVSAQMAIFRKLGFEGTSKEEFKVLCQLNEDSVAFIVELDDLKNYTDDAKKSMADLSWTSARDALAESGVKDGIRMGVGTKGLVLYERVDIGNFIKEGEQKSGGDLIGVKSSATINGDTLESFFPEPAIEMESKEIDE